MDRTTASHQRGPTVQLPVIGVAPPWGWYAGLLAQAFEACRSTNAKGPMEKTETESGNGNGKRKRKRKQKTETENGNGKLVMKWKRLHVVSCNNARASYSMLYIALASSVYSLDRTARQDSLKLQPFPCRTS